MIAALLRYTFVLFCGSYGASNITGSFNVGYYSGNDILNKGTLNWSPTTSTSYTVPAGYYTGGTLNSTGAYNAGISAADARSNPNSTNYKSGYNAGVASTTGTATSSRILSGYTAWVNGSKITGTMAQCLASNITLSGNSSKTYSAGYYPSSWTVTSEGSYTRVQTLTKIIGVPQDQGNVETLTFDQLTKIDGFTSISVTSDRRVNITNFEVSGNTLTIEGYNDGYGTLNINVSATAFMY